MPIFVCILAFVFDTAVTTRPRCGSKGVLVISSCTYCGCNLYVRGTTYFFLAYPRPIWVGIGKAMHSRSTPLPHRGAAGDGGGTKNTGAKHHERGIDIEDFDLCFFFFCHSDFALRIRRSCDLHTLHTLNDRNLSTQISSFRRSLKSALRQKYMVKCQKWIACSADLRYDLEPWFLGICFQFSFVISNEVCCSSQEKHPQPHLCRLQALNIFADCSFLRIHQRCLKQIPIPHFSFLIPSHEPGQAYQRRIDEGGELQLEGQVPRDC